MVQCTDDFRVTWDDPADGELHWEWDKMHHPRPVPPLCADLVASESEVVFGSRVIALNGYLYASGFTMPSPPPDVAQRGAADVWDNDLAPWIEETCARWRKADYDSMTMQELAESIETLLEEAAEAQRLTMVLAAVFGFPTNLFADFCEEAFGPEGVTLAATLLQGFDNMSSRPGAALADLAEIAKQTPELAAAVRQRDPALIASLDGRFSQRFDECLEEFGWRAEGWGRYHIPTWAEDRRLPLGLIAHYLESEDSPATAMARAREQREAALRAAESRLEGEKLDRFREMLAASLAHTRISEGRAFWQLVIDGSMRVPLLALGGRLVEASVIEDANDVFFLRLDELRAAAGDPSRRFQDTVASRKADLARWEKLEPPPFVGAPGGRDLIPPIFKRAFARFWGEEAPPSEDVNVVTGNAAGRGSVRGRARLVMSLGEAGRLETGDVLVCPSTAPPWTPLFAIAAAVVTDTGGVLSHSAICAREYGIPAVVGTRTGTQRIPDGATVTVDGTAGTVRIER